MSQAFAAHVLVARACKPPVILAGCDVLQGAMRLFVRRLKMSRAIQLIMECYFPSVVIPSADHDGFFLLGEQVQ